MTARRNVAYQSRFESASAFVDSFFVHRFVFHVFESLVDREQDLANDVITRVTIEAQDNEVKRQTLNSRKIC